MSRNSLTDGVCLGAPANVKVSNFQLGGAVGAKQSKTSSGFTDSQGLRIDLNIKRHGFNHRSTKCISKLDTPHKTPPQAMSTIVNLTVHFSSTAKLVRS